MWNCVLGDELWSASVGRIKKTRRQSIKSLKTTIGRRIYVQYHRVIADNKEREKLRSGAHYINSIFYLAAYRGLSIIKWKIKFIIALLSVKFIY